MSLAQFLIEGCAAIMSLEIDIGRNYDRWPDAIGSWLGDDPKARMNTPEALCSSLEMMNLPSDIVKAMNKTIKRLQNENRLDQLRISYFPYWINHHLACGGSMRNGMKLINLRS